MGDEAKAVIRPLGDRVLVVPEALPEKVGGVIIPAMAQEKPRTGKVVSVGTGLLDAQGVRTPPAVAVGETVLYSQYGGVDITIGGVYYLILREGDLLGVVEEEPE